MRSDKKSNIVVFLLVVFLTTMPLLSSGLSFSGYYKSFFNLLIPKSIKIGDENRDIPDLGMFLSKIRIKMSYSPTDWLSLKAEYEVSPTVLDLKELSGFQLVTGANSPKYRIVDLPKKMYPNGNDSKSDFFINQNLDRFYASISFNFADVYIGRQVISWGSAYVINPTDIISPFSFNDIDKEQKSGVDAIRVRIPLGTMDELDIGYIFDEESGLNESAFFIRGKINFLNNDVSVLVLGFKQNLLVGFDLSRSFGGAGFRFESAYVFDKIMDKAYPKELKENYLRLSVGLDYRFSESVYGYAEYHFSSSGRNNSSKYLSNSKSNAYLTGSVYLLGKHYISAGISYRFHPLIPISGFVIYNITDGSIMISPTLEYNISENIYLSLGGFVSMGEGIEYNEKGKFILKSEFGSYPDYIFTSFRIYF